MEQHGVCGGPQAFSEPWHVSREQQAKIKGGQKPEPRGEQVSNADS